MTPMSGHNAREKISRLLEQATQSHEPVQTLGHDGAAVLVAEEDWRAIQESLHLLSVPACGSLSARG